MFSFEARPTGRRKAVGLLELIYHRIVRDVRKSHGNAFLALLTNMLQTIIFVAAFYVMFSVLALRGATLRGDFLLYIMSGIFLFLCHTKALSAVVSSEGPASAMMKHDHSNRHMLLSVRLSLYSIAISIFGFVRLSRNLHTSRHRRPNERAWHAAFILGQRRCNWDGSVGPETMDAGCCWHLHPNLQPRQHDCLRQDVRSQYAAKFYVGDVRLEPTLSHNRPGPWLCVCELHPALHRLGICGPYHGHIPNDWSDGRVLHPQTRLRQLERATISQLKLRHGASG